MGLKLPAGASWDGVCEADRSHPCAKAGLVSAAKPICAALCEGQAPKGQQGHALQPPTVRPQLMTRKANKRKWGGG